MYMYLYTFTLNNFVHPHPFFGFSVFLLCCPTALSSYRDISVNSTTSWSVLKLPKTGDLDPLINNKTNSELTIFLWALTIVLHMESETIQSGTRRKTASYVINVYLKIVAH